MKCAAGSPRHFRAQSSKHLQLFMKWAKLDGKPYIAMEYVEGRPLTMEISLRRDGARSSGALRSCSLPTRWDNAHSRGIIHRDLKSANVMVTPTRPPEVLDFGISRRLDTGHSGSETTRFDKSWESQHSFNRHASLCCNTEVLKGEEGDGPKRLYGSLWRFVV